jgi:hypothetical protein
VGDPLSVQFHCQLLVMGVTRAKAVRWVEKSEWPIDRSLILFAQPGELFAIHDEASANYSFWAIPGRELPTWIAERTETLASGIIIDLGLLISGLIRRVAAWTAASNVDVTANFYEWAESYDVCS